jgi:hypothetical protein
MGESFTYTVSMETFALWLSAISANESKGQKTGGRRVQAGS